MALSQPGAGYRNQSELQRRDRILGDALDSIASQVQAVAKQVNAPTAGMQTPPAAPTSLAVVGAAGFASATITNQGKPGTLYTLQYSTTANFQAPVEIDLGALTTDGKTVSFHAYLLGLTLYFRAAAKYSTSALSGWTYFGGASSPTATTF